MTDLDAEFAEVMAGREYPDPTFTDDGNALGSSPNMASDSAELPT